MFSQNDEERVLCEYFGAQHGRFLDCGAFDGKTFSNSLRLAEQEWAGLSIEPDPHAFCKLLDNYAAHKIQGVASLHAFIGTEPGITKFYGSGGDGVSTANEAHRAKWQSQANYREFFVPVMTIRQVLDRFGSVWEMISLDTESTNLAVLETMPLSEMQTKLICVEHDGHQDKMIEYCESHGLTNLLLENGENLIMARPR